MLNIITSWLSNVPKEWVIIIVSMLPLSELRGAIPLGLSFGIPLSKVFWLSVIGNIIPVVPALFLLEPVSGKLRRFKVWSRFFDWLFERTRKKAETVQRYEALGLGILVAIPLPMTGAWTGVIAASLFKIRFRYALGAIISGVIIAGLIVSGLCTLGINGWKAVVG